MPDISNDELMAVFSKTLNEIRVESDSNDKLFRVSDLKAQAQSLSPGNDLSAWEISYSTANSLAAKDIKAAGIQSAWEISYSTAAAGNVSSKVKPGG